MNWTEKSAMCFHLNFKHVSKEKLIPDKNFLSHFDQNKVY